MGERRREVIDWLVEGHSKSDVGEGLGKMINWLIEDVVELEESDA